MKPKKCKGCGSPFTPARPLQVACGPLCGLELARVKREKAKAQAKKEERKADKVKREKLKTRQQWLHECQVLVNRYCRLRDLALGLGCVSCGGDRGPKYGGAYDAGHFRSVGSAPHLRFFLPQISLQCVTCNRYQGGRALDFRRTLVARKGAAWVEALEARQESRKFDVAYLARLKRIMTKKVRRFEVRYADVLRQWL